MGTSMRDAVNSPNRLWISAPVTEGTGFFVVYHLQVVSGGGRGNARGSVMGEKSERNLRIAGGASSNFIPHRQASRAGRWPPLRIVAQNGVRLDGFRDEPTEPIKSAERHARPASPWLWFAGAISAAMAGIGQAVAGYWQ